MLAADSPDEKDRWLAHIGRCKHFNSRFLRTTKQEQIGSAAVVAAFKALNNLEEIKEDVIEYQKLLESGDDTSLTRMNLDMMAIGGSVRPPGQHTRVE